VDIITKTNAGKLKKHLTHKEQRRAIISCAFRFEIQSSRNGAIDFFYVFYFL